MTSWLWAAGAMAWGFVLGWKLRGRQPTTSDGSTPVPSYQSGAVAAPPSVWTFYGMPIDTLSESELMAAETMSREMHDLIERDRALGTIAAERKRRRRHHA